MCPGITSDFLTKFRKKILDKVHHKTILASSDRMLVAYAPMRQATTLYWKKANRTWYLYISDAAAAVSWPHPNVTYVDTLLTLLQTENTNRNKEFVQNLFMYKFIKHTIKDSTSRLFSGNLFPTLI